MIAIVKRGAVGIEGEKKTNYFPIFFLQSYWITIKAFNARKNVDSHETGIVLKKFTF